MALTSGTQLGTYKITSLIGAGGMGEVYEAHDSKLDRDVAIKVLPEQFARDSERLARFQRNPFFSPDGQWLGFFADGKLKKISVQGGAAVMLCDAADAPIGRLAFPDRSACGGCLCYLMLAGVEGSEGHGLE